MIICGTKNDLRFDTDVIERLKESGSEPVTAARGEAVRHMCAQEPSAARRTVSQSERDAHVVIFVAGGTASKEDS